MKASKQKEALARRVERTFALPDGLLGKSARMELSGNRRLLIEGCRGIAAYEEGLICLRTDSGTIRFSGCDLRMHRLDPACAVITGRLLSIEFLD